MTKKEKQKKVVEDILNKMLEKYSVTIESPEILEDPEWFDNKTLTDDEYREWKEWSINKIRKDLKLSKVVATKEFLYLNFMWGLKIAPPVIKEEE